MRLLVMFCYWFVCERGCLFRCACLFACLYVRVWLCARVCPPVRLFVCLCV